MLENVDLISLLLLTTGGLLAIFGFYRFARQGLPLLPWVVLMLVGVWGVSYGWTHIGETAQSSVSQEITEQLEYFKVTETLQGWCSKLD